MQFAIKLVIIIIKIVFKITVLLIKKLRKYWLTTILALGFGIILGINLTYSTIFPILFEGNRLPRTIVG